MDQRSLTLAEIADLTHSTLCGDASKVVTNVSDLEMASPSDVSFLSNPRYEHLLNLTKAAAVFVLPGQKIPQGLSVLTSENPSKAFQKLIDFFYEESAIKTFFSGIHPSAVIHPTAVIDPTATVGPLAVIDGNVQIGAGTSIGAHVSIGPGTTIGEQCEIHSRVCIRERCFIGNRVVIQPGAVIGSCGFGFATDAAGKHTKLNQLGSVTIEDDVEIGANTAIDRARFKTTRIKRGSKIDNLVQIAHGVEIGEDNIIVAQTGIAGSSKTGKHVVIAGQCAIAGHLSICDGVMIAGKSGVSKSITKPGKYNGIPVEELSKYNRNAVYLRNIGAFVEQLKDARKRLAALEQDQDSGQRD